MKKTIIVLAVCLGGILNAQTFEYGVKSGLNISNLSSGSEQFKDLKERYSFHVGGLVEFKLGEKGAIQAEALYSSQGASRKEGFKDVVKLNYLHFPLMLKYDIWRGINVEAGGYVSVLASAKQKKEIDGTRMNINLKKQVNTYDYGITAGVSTWAVDNVLLGIRLIFSEKELLKGETEYKTLNEVVQFSVGYIF